MMADEDPDQAWTKIDVFASEYQEQCEARIDAEVQEFIGWLRSCVVEAIVDGIMRPYTDEEIDAWLRTQEAPRREWLRSHYREQRRLIMRDLTH